MFEFKYRRFWGNSFNTTIGLAQRTISADVDFGDFDTLEELPETSISVNSKVLNIALGNKWQWETFTIGCDWFGVSIPIIEGDVATSVPPAGASQEALDDYQESIDNLRDIDQTTS